MIERGPSATAAVDFLIAVHGQAVHEDRRRLRRVHDGLGDLVRRQSHGPRRGVGLTHADVNVGVDGVRAAGRHERIVGHDDLGVVRRWWPPASGRD